MTHRDIARGDREKIVSKITDVPKGLTSVAFRTLYQASKQGRRPRNDHKKYLAVQEVLVMITLSLDFYVNCAQSL